MQADPSILNRRDAKLLASWRLPWTPLGDPHFISLGHAWRNYADLSGPYCREQVLGQVAAIFEGFNCAAAIYAAAEASEAYEWRRAANHINRIRSVDSLRDEFARLLASDELIWSGALNQAFLDAGVEWVVVDECLLKARFIRGIFDMARGVT